MGQGKPKASCVEGSYGSTYGYDGAHDVYFDFNSAWVEEEKYRTYSTAFLGLNQLIMPDGCKNSQQRICKMGSRGQ